MFKPDSRIDWPGNIKRLNIDLSSGAAILVDDNGDARDRPSSAGRSRPRHHGLEFGPLTGPRSTQGGVGALLAARDPATRTLYSNTGTDEALQPFGLDQYDGRRLWLPNDAALYAFFGVVIRANSTRFSTGAAGYDISDEDEDGVTDEPRPWILADMLHSKPLVVNYGVRTGDVSPCQSGFAHCCRAPTPAFCICSTMRWSGRLGVLCQGTGSGTQQRRRQSGVVPACLRYRCAGGGLHAGRNRDGTIRFNRPATRPTCISACAGAAAFSTPWISPIPIARKCCGESIQHYRFRRTGPDLVGAGGDAIPGYTDDQGNTQAGAGVRGRV